MNRLKDQTNSADPVEAAGAKLLGAVHEIDDLDAMQARVRLALAHGAQATRATARPWLGLRPAVAMAIVLGLISVCAAMTALVLRRAPALWPAAPTARVAPAFVVPAPSPTPLASVPAPTISTTSPPAPPSNAKPDVARAPNASPKPSAAEAKLVMDGVTALRIARDPARASVLFAEYLDRYPKGALYEEALAYAIEAAVAGESDDALALAERYLRRFPHGRFRAVAEHAKDRIDD